MKDKAILLTHDNYFFTLLPENTPAEVIVSLMGAKVYSQSYGSPYKEENSYITSIKVVNKSELPSEDPTVIDLQKIMEENNRLTRENEALKAKLKPVINDTAIVTI